MTIELQPLHGIGAAVRGVDISQPLDAETAAALGRAWAEHLVLVFRGHQLDEPAQIRFASAFGKLGERSRPAERRPEGADYDGALMLVSNIRRNGVPIGSLPDGEMWFHHDMCYVAKPHRGTFLYAIEVPSTGGNTRFANLARAYETLPQRLKDAIRGRRALHVYDYGTAEKIDIEKRGLDGIKHHWHPVAIRHPVTGRMALYVNRLMTVQIEGLPRDESDAVLLELFDHSENADNVYEHVWTPGDLVMWDNYASMHARTDFPASERRLLRRCTIEGGYVPAE